MRLSAGGGGAGGGVNRFQRSHVQPAVNGNSQSASRQHAREAAVRHLVRFAVVPVRLLTLSLPCRVVTSVNSPGKLTAVVVGGTSVNRSRLPLDLRSGTYTPHPEEVKGRFKLDLSRCPFASIGSL